MASTLQERLAQAASGSSAVAPDPLASDEDRFTLLRIEDIEPDPDQPRKDFSDIDELAASIRTHGLISPIVVSPSGNRRFRIIAGERRFRACRLAGLAQVRAIVRTLEEQSRIEVQLVENIQRKDLHPVEEARVFRRLMDEFRLTQENLAARIGKSPSAISETLRLLDLPETIMDELRTSEVVPKSTLLAIAKESDPEKQASLWQRAKAGELTVRQARGKPHRRASPGTKPKAVFTTAHGASVIVQAETAKLTLQQVRVALTEALASAQSATETVEPARPSSLFRGIGQHGSSTASARGTIPRGGASGLGARSDALSLQVLRVRTHAALSFRQLGEARRCLG